MAIQKKKKTTVGTNVRLSDTAYRVIRKYCAENNLYIGGFVEKVVLERINSEKAKQKAQ
jgi:hypothetical protein